MEGNYYLRKRVIAVLILLASSLFSSISVRIAHSVTTVYINADGSISPFTAPITTADNITYSCIGDMMDSTIQILRDNIILNGNNHTLHGSINLDNCTDVTIEGMIVTASVSAMACTNITISQLILSPEGWDSHIDSSGYNNRIIDNLLSRGAIWISNGSQYVVSRNLIFGADQNSIWPTTAHGLQFRNVANCVVEENEVTGAANGLGVYAGSNCTISMNNVTSCKYGITGNGDGNVVEKNRLSQFTFAPDYHAVSDTTGLEWSGLDNTIFGNIVESSSNRGIVLNLQNSTVTGNIERNCAVGITISGDGNMIFNNTITDNIASMARAIGDDTITAYGLILSGYNMVLRNNTIERNSGSFALSLAGDLSRYINDVDVSNEIDGKPIYYWINKHDLTIPTDAGYLALINCSGMTIQGLNLTNNGQGMFLAFTTNSTIKDNNVTTNVQGVLLQNCPQTMIMDNSIARNNPGFNIKLENSPNSTIYRNFIASSSNGIVLVMSDNAKIVGNTFMFNYYGANLYIDGSSFCVVYHNNFVEEPAHAQNQIVIVSGSNNTFDNGYPCGGNYWSDYSGIDTYNTGIGFPSYTISGEAQDMYPLMGHMHYYDVSVSANATHIELESNSTISDFQYSESAKYIRFNTEGHNGTVGFCRIAVPQFVYENLWHSNVSIFVNGTLTLHTNFTDSQSVYLYFTYTQSTHDIVAVPEYLWLVFTVLPILAMVGVTFGLKWYKNFYKRRTRNHRLNGKV
jgi:parallel beta-helix repeat protein